MIVVNALVEGRMDEAVAKRIIEAAGHLPGTVYGRKGVDYLKEKLQGFNKASEGTHYLVLVDLMDTKLSCPPKVVALWLPNRSSSMLFRIVVREVESWILADRENIASFLKISITRVPSRPEEIPDPKRALVNLARKSKSVRLRSALIPDKKSTAQVGKLYTSEMTRFIENRWEIESARRNAPSLDRCLKKLKLLGL